VSTGFQRAPQVRIGDVERESAVTLLGEHFAAGRLTHEEFDERSTRAYAARTHADLAPLFWDLPALPPASHGQGSRRAGALAPTAGHGGGGHRRWFGPGLAPVLLVVIAVLVLGHLPWPLLLLVGWLWWARTFRYWCHGHSSGSRRAVRGSWS